MKKVCLLFAVLLSTMCGLAQGNPKHITFEGVSFGESRENFIFQLHDKLGWKVSLDDDDLPSLLTDHFKGEYRDSNCSALVTYTPITKRPVNMSFSITYHKSLVNANFNNLISMFTKLYGTPFSIENIFEDIRIWKIKDVGVVFLTNRAQRMIEIEIVDEANLKSYYKELEVIDSN